MRLKNHINASWFYKKEIYARNAFEYAIENFNFKDQVGLHIYVLQGDGR